MKGSMLKFAVCLTAVGSLAFCSSARTCTWTGKGEDGAWMTAANWDQSFEYGATAKFCPSGDLAVSMDYGSTLGYMPSVLRFESGNTTLTSGESTVYMVTKNNEIYVADGATATIVFKKHFGAYTTESVFRKTGGGTLIFRCGTESRSDFDNINSYRPLMSVDAGTLKFEASAGSVNFCTTNVVVAAGAKLVFDGECHMTGDTDLTLEGGSEFRLTDADKCSVGRLFGSGPIVAETGTKASVITLYPKAAQDEPYSGVVSGNVVLNLGNITVPFVVQSADQFAGLNAIRIPKTAYSSMLRFKSGIGTFRIGALDGYSIGTVYVQDEDGNPITIRCGITTANGLTFEGPGTLLATNMTENISTAAIKMTGWIGAASGGRLTLGTGSAGSFDLTRAGTSLAGILSESGGMVRFNPPAFSDVEIPVRGDGSVGSFGKGVNFLDLVLDNARELWMYSPTTLSAGDVNVDTVTGSGGPSRIGRFTGGRTYYGRSKGAKETATALTSRDGTETYGSHDVFSLSIEGGEFWWMGGNGLHHLYLRGGVFRPTSGCYRGMTANSIKNGAAHTVFDGGLAELYAKGTDDFKFFTYHGTYDNATYTKFYVSEKGGTVRAKKPNGQTGNFSFTIPNPVEVYTNVATSGTLTFTGWGDFKFDAPMTLNGPVAFRDGTAVVTEGQLTGSTAPFGSGDLVLRSARVFCDERSGAGHGKADIALATGSDSAIVYEGACEIAARHSNDNTAEKAITANAVRRAGKGSVLFFRDGVSDGSNTRRIGDAGRSPVRFATPPASDPDSHLLVQPIVIGTTWGDWPAVYDAERGLVSYDAKYATVTNLTDCTSSTLLTPAAGAKATLANNQTVRVAGVRCWNWSGVSTGDKARLVVGNGTDPALVCLGVCSSFVGANGYVDFGTSEGIFVIGNVTYGSGGKEPDDDWGMIINTHLTGSGGVSYVADPHLLRNQHVALYDSAEYTGGTRISGVRILPHNTACFSSGDVHLFGGEASGGAVVFKMSGTWANAFHIAGHGYRDTSDDIPARSKGCLEFRARNVTLSGPVEIVEEASVNATNLMTGTFSGVVSGDRLKLFQSEGLVRLTNANTYTGGTEVAQSTLQVSREGGLGTGELLLDDGTVVFANSSAITVANRLCGAGLLKLTDAAVEFTGDTNDVRDITVDYPGLRLRLANYPTFATVTNSSATRTELTLAAPGAHAIDPSKFAGANIRLTLEAGATLDLGGGTLSVERFNGDRSAVNGTFAEKNPRRGLMMLVR